MKIKQVIFTVYISAITALLVMVGFSKWSKNNNSYTGQQNVTLPSNYKYAGFLDGTPPPGGSIDFTLPAAAATPAVVHIKQINNYLPKIRPNNLFSNSTHLPVKPIL